MYLNHIRFEKCWCHRKKTPKQCQHEVFILQHVNAFVCGQIKYVQSSVCGCLSRNKMQQRWINPIYTQTYSQTPTLYHWQQLLILKSNNQCRWHFNLYRKQQQNKNPPTDQRNQQTNKQTNERNREYNKQTKTPITTRIPSLYFNGCAIKTTHHILTILCIYIVQCTCMV